MSFIAHARIYFERVADGATFEIDSSGDVNFQNFSDFGMPPVRRLTEQGPFQDGVTDIGFRVDERMIALGFFLIANNSRNLWTRRNNLLGFFKPDLDGIHLCLQKLDFERKIKVFLYRDMTLGSEHAAELEGQRVMQRVVVDFLAPDPAWFDPTLKTATYTSVAISQLVLPMEFPIVFGTYVINPSTLITYAGTWKTQPTIIITGPVIGPTIRNLQTGLEIKLNYSIAAGEVVTMTLEYGNKTVTTSFGNQNLIGCITDDSDFEEFGLVPDPEAAGGVQQVSVIGTGMTVGVSQVALQWYEKFIGI